MESNLEKKRLWKYFSKELGWGNNYESRIVFEFLWKARCLASNGIVLDYGSGFKRYAPFFDNSFFLAQEHPESGQKNKGIIEYDILSTGKIPLTDDCIDLVLSTSSLEHLENPKLFFNESYRVLKHGGYIAIQCPFAYPEHETPYDFQRLTRYGLFRDLSEAGFELKINEIKPLSSSLTTINSFIEQAIKEDLLGNTRNKLKKNVPEFSFIQSEKARTLLNKFCYLILLAVYLLKNKLFSRLLLLGIAKIFKLISKRVDKGPSQEKSLMPVGWIVIAKKASRTPPENVACIDFGNRKETLKTLFSKCQDFHINNEQIVEIKSI